MTVVPGQQYFYQIGAGGTVNAPGGDTAVFGFVAGAGGNATATNPGAGGLASAPANSVSAAGLRILTRG